MWLKRPWEPGKAIYTEQSYPSTQFQLSTPMSFWLVGIPDRISLKRFSRCGGKDNAMLNVYTTHPRRTCQVDHVQAHVPRFFSNNTSLLLAKSPESQVRNTFSREWKKVFRTWRRRWEGPWDNPSNLLTKISM